MRSFLVAATPADAWHLSGELASLIDELIIEDVAWEKLDPLVLPEFDPYWRITLDFLEYRDQAMAADSGRTRTRGQGAAADRAHRGANAAACRMAPWLARSSRSARPDRISATARLLAAIARAPRGAVVLPGLDQDLDASSWALIAGGPESDGEASFTHPQAALCRLLRILQVRREDVVSLGEVRAPSCPARQIRLGGFASGGSRPANGSPIEKASVPTNLRPRCKASV